MKALVGTLLAGAMMMAGCSSAPLAPPTTNVTGNWVGSWQYENLQMGSGDMRGTFEQDGSKVSGNFQVTGPVLNRVAIITGTVSGNEILLSEPASGRLTVSGSEITGVINGLNVAKVTLRRM